MRYIDGLKDFADSHEDLRWKIVNYGFDQYLRTGKLIWSFDPAIGTPADWKKKMKNVGCWGDEVFLYLASNVLSADIVIVPAFRESVYILFFLTYLFTTPAPEECFITSPPRAPLPEECSDLHCSHIVIFENHFDRAQWDHYREQEQAHRDHSDKEVNEDMNIYCFFCLTF